VGILNVAGRFDLPIIGSAAVTPPVRTGVGSFVQSMKPSACTPLGQNEISGFCANKCMAAKSDKQIVIRNTDTDFIKLEVQRLVYKNYLFRAMKESIRESGCWLAQEPGSLSLTQYK
jgi:hypothetical protein